MNSGGKDLLKFFMLVGDLKHIPRTGWVRKNVQNPERIAGHMYRMGVMSLFFNEADGVDRDKCMRMALIHDVAETIVGDITPNDPVTPQEKKDMESEAIRSLANLLEDANVGKEMVDLWQEYEDAQSPEAKVVKDLDKFDMILQAFEYEKEMDSPQRLEEFFSSTKGVFKTDKVKQWVADLNAQRTKHAKDEDDSSAAT